MLENLEHRGAAGADAESGDGAGILMPAAGPVPARGRAASSCRALYGVAVCFLPRDAARRAELERLLEQTVAAEGQAVVGWRDVPVDDAYVGRHAGVFAPVIRQLFVARGARPRGRTRSSASCT